MPSCSQLLGAMGRAGRTNPIMNSNDDNRERVERKLVAANKSDGAEEAAIIAHLLNQLSQFQFQFDSNFILPSAHSFRLARLFQRKLLEGEVNELDRIGLN